MPKSAHKRALKKSDFQKTKLKVGKGKAPAENATATNVQVRDLRILEQYNHGNDEVDLSERPIKQLFNNLRNGSQQVRAAAIAGIKDAVSRSPIGGARYLGMAFNTVNHPRVNRVYNS